jgi:hypothetical protein
LDIQYITAIGSGISTDFIAQAPDYWILQFATVCVLPHPFYACNLLFIRKSPTASSQLHWFSASATAGANWNNVTLQLLTAKNSITTASSTWIEQTISWLNSGIPLHQLLELFCQ